MHSIVFILLKLLKLILFFQNTTILEVCLESSWLNIVVKKIVTVKSEDYKRQIKPMAKNIEMQILEYKDD